MGFYPMMHAFILLVSAAIGVVIAALLGPALVLLGCVLCLTANHYFVSGRCRLMERRHASGPADRVSQDAVDQRAYEEQQKWHQERGLDYDQKLQDELTESNQRRRLFNRLLIALAVGAGLAFVGLEIGVLS